MICVHKLLSSSHARIDGCDALQSGFSTAGHPPQATLSRTRGQPLRHARVSRSRRARRPRPFPGYRLRVTARLHLAEEESGEGEGEGSGRDGGRTGRSPRATVWWRRHALARAGEAARYRCELDEFDVNRECHPTHRIHPTSLISEGAAPPTALRVTTPTPRGLPRTTLRTPCASSQATARKIHARGRLLAAARDVTPMYPL